MKLSIIYRLSLFQQMQNAMLLQQPVIAFQHFALPISSILLFQFGQLSTLRFL